MTREQHLVSPGAAGLILGSVAVFAFRIAHGDLPTDAGAEALAYVAAFPLDPVVHLGDCLGVLVCTGGLVALGGSLRHPAAWAVGRLGWSGVFVGLAIFGLGTVQFVRPNVVFPGVLLYGGGMIASQLWSLVLGGAVWRRAATAT